MATKKPAPKAAKPKVPVKKPSNKAKVKAAANPAPVRPVGRPSLYKPEYAERAYEYCLLGATEPQMAEFFGVIIQTLYNWKTEHPEFLDAVTRGKEVADAKVARALFHRATGYEHPEDDIRVVAGQIEITPTVKRYPPDTAAATLWLKNRQPKLWRDKVEMEHSGGLTVKRMTDEELLIVAAQGLRNAEQGL